MGKYTPLNKVSALSLRSWIGNDYIMPKGKRWPKRGVTEIRVGKPMLFGKDQKYSDTTATLEKAVREL
jgi:hypothetical protein